MTSLAPRKVAARKARNAHSKTRENAEKARKRSQKTASKVAAKLRNDVTTETVRDTHRKIDPPNNQFPGSQVYDRFPAAQVPDTLRVLAERNVAQTRELYERSKNTLQAMLDSWQTCFGAAGISLNRAIIDIAERNINIGFDLATDLAGAKNLTEVMELQTAYWRKVTGAVQTRSKTGAARRNQ
jgi:hypothetical protein